MKITIKQEQRQTRLGLPSVSNLRDIGAKTTLKIVLLTVICSLLTALSSCSKEELVDPPKVILNIDWSNRTEGIAIPADYKVVINDQIITYQNISNMLPSLNAGIYSAYIYNVADKIAVNGTTAAVSTSGQVVNSNPGWLFYSDLDIDFENDKEKTVTAVMQQQVRRLDIELTVTEGDIDNIKSITASLSGVANTIDMKTNTHSGTGLKIAPVFTKSGNKLIASVRLIGLTAETQNLRIDIIYTVGAPQQLITDMSSYLTGFSVNKHIPATLTGSISITSGIGIDYNSTISGWKSQGQIGSDANEQ